MVYKKLKRPFAIVLVLVMLFSLFSINVLAENNPQSIGTVGRDGVKEAIGKVAQYLNTSSYTSDWVTIGQSIAGQTIAPAYLNGMVQTVNQYFEDFNNGIGKVTDLEKWTLSILAAGGDPRNIAGHDLVAGIYNFYIPSGDRDITFQGLNGVIFGLIALDADHYPVPADARYSRDYLISYLLDHQNSDGGWDLGVSGTSDVDITSMTIQALAPYYTRPDVKTVVDKAVDWLSGVQRSDGGFASSGTVNSESISQTVIALCANGIDPASQNFIKNSRSLLDALLAFQQPDGSFRHTLTETRGNNMATEQAYLALLAYNNYVKDNGVSTMIYYFGNTQTSDREAPVITTSLESGTVNVADYTFTATALDAVEGAVPVQVVFNGQLVSPGTDSSYSVTLTSGSNIITLKAQDSKNNTAELSYTLTYKPEVILVTKVTLPAAVTYMLGSSAPLAAAVIPANATDGTLRWSSSDDTVAVVDANGQVTAQQVGTATITAEANDGSGESAVCQITVVSSNDVSSNTETVSFTLLGTAADGSKGIVNTLAAGNLTVWIARTTLTVNTGATVYDVFTKVLRDNGYTYAGAENNYVSSITSPSGVRLLEFTNGPNSGWMYMVNGTHPEVGLRDYILKNGDNIVWHYTDDYTKEENSGKWNTVGGTSTSTSGVTAPGSTTATDLDSLRQANEKELAALNNVTVQQQAGAGLPENVPQLSSAILKEIVLKAKDGVRLSVPPGALNNQSKLVNFAIRIGEIRTPPQTDKAVKVMDPLKYQRQFEMTTSAGIVSEEKANFTSPVTLTFPIATDDLPAGITTGQLAIYWWDSDKNDWLKLGGVYDPLSRTLAAPIYHISTYAVMADISDAPERLAGADRFLTANAVADQGWKAGADNVVLVSANTFADALAATPLAFKLNAPILLTEQTALPSSTRGELQKLGAKRITLIGGNGVICEAVEAELQKTYGKDNIQRYGGHDRYETAAFIAAALGTTGKAVLANGEDGNFPNVLAISPYAAYNGIPILFTETKVLPAVTIQALTDQKVSSTLVVGGETTVSALVYNQLSGANRYGGGDNYATATALAERLKLNPNRIYIATGQDIPDALTTGNLAAHTLSPLIMVDQTVPQASGDYLSKYQGSISKMIIVGGEGVISAKQESVLRAIVKQS